MCKLITVGCVLFLAATFATTADAGPPGWSILASPNPPAPTGQLASVSCPTRADCFAVGSYTRADGDAVTLAERSNGGSWTLEPTQNPPGAQLGVLNGVSCASPTSCLAVGRYLDRAGTSLPLAERWDGADWSIVPAPSPAGAAGSTLTAVSCTSSSSCIAVGSLTNRAGFPAPGTLAERWDGERWRVVPMPSMPGSALNGVSCSSRSACTAVGSQGDPPGPPRTLAERWDGSTWTVQPTADPEDAGAGLGAVSCPSASDCAAVGTSDGATFAERWDGARWTIEPIPNPDGTAFAEFQGVACASASSCLAVGLYLDDSGTAVALAEHWNGSAWSIESTAVPPGVGGNGLAGVACASTSACTGVGAVGNQTLAEGWDGTRWTSQSTVDPSGAHSSVLNAVACPAPATCTAVGEVDDASFSAVGTLVERGHGSRWHIQPSPNPPGATGGVLAGVACPRSRSCMAVGAAPDRSGVFHTLAERWNGRRWRILPTPDPAGAAGGFLASVSCISATSCIATGNATDKTDVSPGTLAEAWDGRRWRILPTPDPAGAAGSVLPGVSCLSASACFAVGFAQDSNGAAVGTLAERWNGREWTIVPTPNPAGAAESGLGSVSCTSPSACIAVGFAGDADGGPAGTLAEHWDGTAWVVLTTPSAGVGQDSLLNSVSCASANRCTAVGLNLADRPPLVLAERWNGATWSTQSTPEIPFAYDVAPPSVACPSASTCTAVGGFTNNQPHVTLVERWNAGAGDPLRSAPTAVADAPAGATSGNAASAPSRWPRGSSQSQWRPDGPMSAVRVGAGGRLILQRPRVARCAATRALAARPIVCAPPGRRATSVGSKVMLSGCSRRKANAQPSLPL
jgi:hypothetical protein